MLEERARMLVLLLLFLKNAMKIVLKFPEYIQSRVHGLRRSLQGVRSMLEQSPLLEVVSFYGMHVSQEEKHDRPHS